MAGNNQQLVMVGIVGVAGYFAYKWYAAPGGYADQQTCGKNNTDRIELQALAAQINSTAKAANNMSAVDFITVKMAPNAKSDQDKMQLACAYVAVTKYPDAVLPPPTHSPVALPPAASPASPYQAPPASPYQAPPAPVVAPAPAPVAFNSLDSIYQRLSAAAGAGPLTADQFNWYLAQQLPSGAIAPDPLLVFNASGAWDRTVPMTLANYWGLMAPYLRSNLGLSGLGVYGGLGSLVRRYR